MSDQVAANRPQRRQMIYRHATLGDFTANEPLAEWAYITPRFPRGIARTRVARLATDLQCETAYFWFTSNLRPYSLEGGGPYFGFSGGIGIDPIGTVSIAGFGQGVFAPPRLKANAILEDEFRGVLHPSTISTVAASLDGDWMWIDPLPLPASMSKEAVYSTLQERLAEIIRLLKSLDPKPGEVGHNRPPDELPLTSDEIAEALQRAAEMKAIIAATDAGSLEVENAWVPIRDTIEKLGRWSIEQAGIFFSGIAVEGGKAIGKQLPWVIGLTITGYGSEISHFLTEWAARLLH